jgi:serine/threonine protein kinase
MSSPERQSLAQYSSASGRENKETTPKTSSRYGPADPKEVLSQQFGSLVLLERRHDCELYLARARSSDDSQPILLKTLRSDVALDPKKLELFQLEAGAAAKLTHPNIVVSFPAENLEGVHFARIKYQPETTMLSQLLEREGWLEIEQAVGIIAQIADALDYAHECGVLHLRLEPRSILIGSNGTVLLRDFGIDEHGGVTWAQTRRAESCQVHYISPEVAGEHNLDARSDVYSLGVIFYQMLTDRFPIDAEDSVGIRSRHLTHQPLLPHYYSPETPEAVSEVIGRMLEKDPARRYQDMRSFRAALYNAIGHSGFRSRQDETVFEQPPTSLEDELSDFEVSPSPDSSERHELTFETREHEQPEILWSGSPESIEPIEQVSPATDQVSPAIEQVSPATEQVSPAIEPPRPGDSVPTIEPQQSNVEASGSVESIDAPDESQQEIEPAASIPIQREPWEPPAIVGIEPEIPSANSSPPTVERLREIESHSEAARSAPEFPYSIDRLSFDPTAQTRSIGSLSPVFLVVVLASAAMGGVFVLSQFERNKVNQPQNQPVVQSPEPSAAESPATPSPPTAAQQQQPPANPSTRASVPTNESGSALKSTNKNGRASSTTSSTASVGSSQSNSMSRRSQRTWTKKPWRRYSRRFGPSYFDR